MSGALPLWAARPWARQSGPVARVSRARVVWTWGPVTCPTVCTLASQRCALWGTRGGVPRGGGGGAVVRGVWGQALTLPLLPVPGAGSRGPLSTSAGAGVQMWGPGTVPLACLPFGGCCAPRGWSAVAPGGHLSPF